MADVAVAVEERGFDALFQGDHTHIPSRRTTPFLAGGELPDVYPRLVDPFVSLATAAARTQRIELGTTACLVAQRDPIVTAKQVASLDYVSGGRFLFGIGYGWNVEEAADHGVEWTTRRARVHEYVAAMKALWTQEKATYRGRFVNFDEAWAWPKPVRKPHPPVILGAGTTPRVFEQIVTWADGWIPVPTLGHRPEDVVALRRFAEDHGRDPATIAIVVNGLPPEQEAFDPWVALGVYLILVGAPSQPIDDVRRALDIAARVLMSYRD
jgi:probable F420-dependent oxidoreductase